jgi:TolA-binding protein
MIMNRGLTSLRMAWPGAALFLLMATGARLEAAGKSETRAFESARMAFEDHAWDRAEKGFADFVIKYPASESYATAVLYEARARLEQAHANQRSYRDVVDLLSAQQGHAGKAMDQFVYWTARTYYDSKDYQAAASTFARLNRDYPDSTLRLDAVFSEAEALSKQGNWAGVIEKLRPPESVFQQMARTNMENDLTTRGFLLLAEAELEQGDYETASRVLEMLSARKLAPDMDWRRQCLLCSIQLAGGHAEDALRNSTNLLDAAAGNPEFKARSIALQGQIRERMGLLPEAITTYETNLGNGVPSRWQRDAVLRIVELTLKQGKTDEAAGRLEDYLAKHPNERGTDFELLNLGELRLKRYEQSGPGTPGAGTNLLQQARECFQKIIDNFTNSDFLGRAQLNLGWCYSAEGRIAESQAAFSNAVEHLVFSEEQAMARFKVADTMYQLKNFPGAISNYTRVLDQYGSLEEARTNLFEQALYQIVRAGVGETNLAIATGAMNRMLSEFPMGQMVDPAMLELGQALHRQQNFRVAREWFSKLTARSPESALAPIANLAIADTYEKEGDWTNAISQYDAWLVKYTNDPARPRAEFSLAWAKSGAGLTNAFGDFTNFVARYPTNELTPRAQYWIGDYHWNRQEYTEAETSYQEVFQNTNVPVSELMFRARMMAGRVAMQRRDDEAIGYFTNLVNEAKAHPTECPTNLVLEAQFACGDAYVNSAATNHFENAIDYFQGIVSTETNGSIVPRAWGRLGDCYRQLAANDPSYYAKATNAYQQVMDSKLADSSTRSLAECGLAMTLEVMARAKPPVDRDLLELALAHYENVVYGNNLAEDEKGDASLVEKAGLAAGKLAEDLHEWDHAVRLYERLEVILPPLKSTLDTKKAKAQQKLDQLLEKSN